MDYSQMTKAELIEKLNEQKHLAQAVEAKDREISILNKEKEKKDENLLQELSQIKEQKQKEIEGLKKSIKELNEQLIGSMTKEKVEEYVKNVQEENKNIREVANYYIKIHTDFLKQTQQNLEMAIFTEDLVSQKIKNPGGK
jgi:alpha-glucuronidase